MVIFRSYVCLPEGIHGPLLFKEQSQMYQLYHLYINLIQFVYPNISMSQSTDWKVIPPLLPPPHPTSKTRAHLQFLEHFRLANLTFN